jgi:hypothetical protein
LPKPESPAANLGNDVHRHHEAYLKEGKPYDLTEYSGRVAQCTQHLLPAPGSIPYEVEKERTIEIGGRTVQAPQFGGFSTIRIAGIVFGGKQDLRWGEIRPEGRVAIVHDHKTTGSLDWAKDTKEKLLDHPQAPIYALIGMQDFQTELAELRWTYALKDTRPKPFKSWHMVTDVEAYDAVSKFLQPASEMELVVKLANSHGLRAINLPFNPAACGKYGGCPFQSKCNLTTKDRLAMVQNPNIGDFVKTLQGMNPQITTQVPNVAPPPFQAPAQPAFLQQAQQPAPPFNGGLVGGAVPFQVAQTQAPAQPAFMQAVQQPAPQHYGNAVNPPEAQLPPQSAQPEVQAAPAAEAPKAKRTRRTKAQIEADNAAAAQATQGFQAPGTTVQDIVQAAEETPVEPDMSPKDLYLRSCIFLAQGWVAGIGAPTPDVAAHAAEALYDAIQARATARFPG